MRVTDGGIQGAVGQGLARSMRAFISGALRPLLQRATTRMPPNPNGRRFCILHLDGVSRDTLVRAVERGQMPFLARLLRSGEYRLSPCWSGAPSSTPAFQAGLLYGAREPDIPGFLWYDRARRQEVRMDRSADAGRVEAGLASHAEGLLHDGSAAFSIFAGGAEVNGYSMAGWSADRVQLVTSRHDHWHLAAATAAHSMTAARVVARLARESGAAVIDLFRQSARVGRFQHEPTFLLHRVELAIGAREAATWGTVLDLVRGVPALYVCFGDYDEIAHRRNPESGSSLSALGGMDWSLARVFAAAAALPELNYDFYVLSDHGQVETRPFEELMGVGLQDYMALAIPERGQGPPRLPEEAVRELARLRGFERAASALPASLQARARELSLEAARSIATTRGDSEWLRVLDEVVCIDAGDISHVYLGHERRPLEAAEIEQRYERILKVLVGCPAIGIVAARGGRAGFAWHAGKKIDLAEPAELRELAIGYGGALVGEFIAKMLTIPSAGDLVVYGNGLPEGDVAFAWEFGSHAGVGRSEVETFVVHPSWVDFDFNLVHHGADLHELFVRLYQRAGPTLH